MERNNSSEFMNANHPRKFSIVETSAIVIFMTVTFLAALLGNTIVIGVILRVHSMQTATNMLLVNLSVADLVIAMLNLPFKTVDNYIMNHWPFGNFMCKLTAFCHIFAFFVSILSLVAVAYERYTTVCKPKFLQGFGLTLHRVKYVIIVIWVAGASGASPMLKFFKTTPWVCPDGRGVCEYCASTGLTIDSLKAYSVIVVFLFFMFPLSAMSFAYIRIAQKVWQSARNTSAMRLCHDNERSTKARITKISLGIILSFVIAWGPIFSKRMYDYLSGAASKMPPETGRIIYMLFHCLQYSNCALNPMIYSFISDRFRQALCQLYRRVYRTSNKSSEYGGFKRRSERFTGQVSLSREGQGEPDKICDDKLITENKKRGSIDGFKSKFLQEPKIAHETKRALPSYESTI